MWAGHIKHTLLAKCDMWLGHARHAMWAWHEKCDMWPDHAQCKVWARNTQHNLWVGHRDEPSVRPTGRRVVFWKFWVGGWAGVQTPPPPVWGGGRFSVYG